MFSVDEFLNGLAPGFRWDLVWFKGKSGLKGSMPTIEYHCPKCAHTFKQVVFRGDEKQPRPCPKCKSTEVKPSLRAESLFNGISNFSSLAGDTNWTRWGRGRGCHITLYQGSKTLLCGWLSSDRLQSELLPAHVNGTIRDSEGDRPKQLCLRLAGAQAIRDWWKTSSCRCRSGTEKLHVLGVLWPIRSDCSGCHSAAEPFTDDFVKKPSQSPKDKNSTAGEFDNVSEAPILLIDKNRVFV